MRPHPVLRALAGGLALVAVAASAQSADEPAPMRPDAIGYAYYTCVRTHALAAKATAEQAVSQAHKACEGEATGMEVRLMIQFEPVFSALGPGLREPQEEQLRQNVQEIVADIDAQVLRELGRAKAATP